MKYLLLLVLPLCLFASFPKVHFPLTTDPVDVVIPCSPKDLETLDLCIEGIRENGQNIRRVIVVSSKKLTDKAEWFDEGLYPFTKQDLALEIFGGDEPAARQFLEKPGSRIGWIYQQFLKFYAPLVIPDISPNVLMLDSDVIFFRPVTFVKEDGGPLFAPGYEYVQEYFDYMRRLLPGLEKAHPQYSGVSHHMLFQRPIVEDLFALVSAHHQMEPWKALCRCIKREALDLSCMSEYEIYFHFTLRRTDQGSTRTLRWLDISSLRLIAPYRKSGYHYVACHEWRRSW